MPIPRPWHDPLALPAIAAPMTAVVGPDPVIAACRSGTIGAFLTHNAPEASATIRRNMRKPAPNWGK